MPKTETRLTDIQKQKWQEFCQSCSISEANMLRMMICKVSPDAANANVLKENKTNKITIRLSDENLKKTGFQGKN